MDDFIESGGNSIFLRRVLNGLRPFLSTLSPQQTKSLKLVVGVSGGADSLALLHSLHKMLGVEALIAVHVNHGLRVEAEDDARFVQQTAVSLGIQYKSKKIEVT